DAKYHAEDGELIALGVEPKPFQKPHPPIWQMADSTESHGFAGSQGINAMCFSSSAARIREAWTAYQEAASRAQGQEVPFGEGLAVMRPTYVAPTFEEAVNDTRWGANQLGAWGASNPHKAKQAVLTEEELTKEDVDSDWFDFQRRHDMILVGSPDSVSEQIERLQSELNCRHLAIFLNFPGLPFEKVVRCLNLFAEQVMPRFQA
ncbi:MAG: LLM class flavin-dependent oxidoreductase, partial [Dehalococcoidia bacterium]